MVAYQWLTQDSPVVAPVLLGWEIVTRVGGKETAGRIVETEAYFGSHDPASHAYHGRTPRNVAMFLGAGHIYTYRSYGIHTCLNIVTGRPSDLGQAVLIRALEPTTGLEVMAKRRGLSNPALLTSGPGRLAQALGLTLADSGSRLGEIVSLRPPAKIIKPEHIVSGPRIGISTAKDLPWRFIVINSQFLSRK